MPAITVGFGLITSVNVPALNPAKCLGISDSHGTIEKGTKVDLVLLEADP